MARTPEQIAADWASRTSQSTDKMRDGIMGTTVAPGQKAASQKSVWVQQTTASADKWARNTAAVDLPTWQQKTIDKGLPRIAQGVQTAQPAVANFHAQLAPHIDQVKRSLPARGNLEQNIARSAAFIRGMSQFQYRR